MSKLISSINITPDGFCGHESVIADEEHHQFAIDLLKGAGPTVGASLVERVLCVSHTCACIEKRFVHLPMRRQTDNRNYKMGYFNFIDYYRHKYALHKAKLHTLR